MFLILLIISAVVFVLYACLKAAKIADEDFERNNRERRN